MKGGNGIDGETLLTWLDPIEMGGTLLLEAVGVTLSPGSSGVLAGFFVGLGTAVGLHCWVSGNSARGHRRCDRAATGAGHSHRDNVCGQSGEPVHAARRVHCPESERALTLYYSYGDSGPIGGRPDEYWRRAKIQMEIQEFVNGVAAMPVTLYDGAITNCPAVCTLTAASSINLNGTMRALHLTNLGSGWVVSTPQRRRVYAARGHSR